MPATQIDLDDLNESLKRIINIGNWKHVFRMCHEAGILHQSIAAQPVTRSCTS